MVLPNIILPNPGLTVLIPKAVDDSLRCRLMKIWVPHKPAGKMDSTAFNSMKGFLRCRSALLRFSTILQQIGSDFLNSAMEFIDAGKSP